MNMNLLIHISKISN